MKILEADEYRGDCLRNDQKALKCESDVSMSKQGEPSPPNMPEYVQIATKWRRQTWLLL